MLDKILPERVKKLISVRLNPNRIYELRFRSGMPVMINYGGVYYYLGQTGILDNSAEAIYSTSNEIEEIVVKATEYSLYSVNNQILNGYITIEGGVRIGVCGEVVIDNGEIKTIKDFTSLNVRIPHEIRGSSLTALSFINDTKLRSSLIIAPPGAGKTTILRDLCLNLSKEKRNVLLIDERREIGAVSNRKNQLDVGLNVDIISSCPKEYVFARGIRSMRPDLIITDELSGQKEVDMVLDAVASGIAVIASVHSSSMDEFIKRKEFANLIESKLFSRYIFLSDKNGPGTYDSIYDADLKCIYYGLR